MLQGAEEFVGSFDRGAGIQWRDGDVPPEAPEWTMTDEAGLHRFWQWIEFAIRSAGTGLRKGREMIAQWLNSPEGAAERLFVPRIGANGERAGHFSERFARTI